MRITDNYYTRTAHVLIYPYWNVNLIDNAYYIKDGKRFNLSILECKFLA